mmetsp:Transcript_18028/g.19823  ORF Transcript_18028/g.19823 Transcript_18028/m.19823 type:complete len:100 (-) Transcript_18028:59-358(-)
MTSSSSSANKIVLEFFVRTILSIVDMDMDMDMKAICCFLLSIVTVSPEEEEVKTRLRTAFIRFVAYDLYERVLVWSIFQESIGGQQECQTGLSNFAVSV